jgi:hypothetical protein
MNPPTPSKRLSHDAEVGKGFVVQARDQERLVRVHLRGEVRQAEEVGAEDDAVVVPAVRPQVVVQRPAVNAVGDPRLFVVGSDFAAPADGVLDAEKGLEVAVLVYGKVVGLQGPHAPRPCRPRVLPGEVVFGAGGQEGDPAAGAGGVFGQVLEEGLGAAYRRSLGQAGTHKSQVAGGGHDLQIPVRRPRLGSAGAFRGHFGVRCSVFSVRCSVFT